MKIRCPDCATVYDVPEAIALAGAEVQCARCASVFAATPVDEPAPLDEAATAEATAAFAAEAFDATPPPDEIRLPAIDLPPEPEPEPEAEAEADAWEAALAAWEQEAEAGETVPAAAFAEPDPATAGADVVNLLSEEERALFSALLGGATAAPAADDLPDVPPVAAELPRPADVDWFDEDAAPRPPLQTFDEIEVKDPVLPPEPDDAAEAADATDESDETEDEPAAGEARPPRLWIGWTALAAALLATLATALFAREAIGRLVPGMADLYALVGLPVNVRGLDFAGLSQQWTEQDGRPRLVVRGEIRNVTDIERPLPELVFAMHDASGMEFFQWVEKVEAKSLPPRSGVRFRAQIPAPPDRARQLHIRFAK